MVKKNILNNKILIENLKDLVSYFYSLVLDIKKLSTFFEKVVKNI